MENILLLGLDEKLTEMDLTKFKSAIDLSNPVLAGKLQDLHLWLFSNFEFTEQVSNLKD